MTSLAYIFTMEKKSSQDYFLAVKCLFVDRFSKFLWQFLRLLGNKRMIRSHFAGGVSDELVCRKAVSKGWYKESSIGYHGNRNLIVCGSKIYMTNCLPKYIQYINFDPDQLLDFINIFDI